MITEKKLNIYDRYNGFVEVYIFENSDLPNKDFDLMDWSTIDELIGNIILLKSGKATLDFQEVLRKNIQRETKSSLVVEHLERIAEKKSETVPKNSSLWTGVPRLKEIIFRFRGWSKPEPEVGVLSDLLP